MKNKTFKKYLAEGFLIVFSVLFALLINKLFDDYKTLQKKEVAIESIKKELNRNALIIQDWKTKHVIIRDKLVSINNGDNDSIKSELLKNKIFDLGILTNQEGLIDNTLTKTAWESAKSTGIVAEFDFETTEILTQVYSLQDLIIDKTISELLNFYFETETHNLNNLEQTLIQFQLRFWELTGQEELMIYLYADSIKKIK
ncbi:hypothetical protein [Maribacter arenosus]|uniref:Uncharacterized protein n=1 Tax=Maribacter arenosus TaxID=1854708 RepID=A0ABR7VCJ1_9FLAO|nr:hypothetical protein [Maribacter arenosus]MBD0851378.1 hypothetical protein [Maribacter arenosus]